MLISATNWTVQCPVPVNSSPAPVANASRIRGNAMANTIVRIKATNVNLYA